MPSLTLWPKAGGISLADSDIFSGQKFPLSNVLLRLDPGAGASGMSVYVGLPTPGLQSGVVLNPQSGVTQNSGGPANSGSSGGLLDGFVLTQGNTYSIPKSRLVSGILTPRIGVPAASSGARLWWECDVRLG